LAQVKVDEATKFAKENKLGFYETSAKLNSNVDEAFGTLVEDIVKELKKKQMGGDDTETVISASKRIESLPEEEDREEVIKLGAKPAPPPKDDTCC